MPKPLSKTKIKSLNKELSGSFPDNLELIFILQDVEDPYNIGSIFRTADACGASVILTGTTPTIGKNSEIQKTSMGMDRKVEWEYIKDIEEVISNLKKNDFDIVGVELTEDAKVYDEYVFKNKTALVLGNEAIGIYKKNLGLCDQIVFIPMFGKGPSLNVNIAAAIVAYEVISKIKNLW